MANTGLQEVRKRGPGRPEGHTTSKQDILDAAEILFAELGYAGTSLRDVAHHTNVTTALIGYYFGSKENLFREVFLRKGLEIAEARRQTLEKLQSDGGMPSVEQLVHSFLWPSWKLRDTVQGKAFLRLQSRLHMEPAEISYDLRREVYQETTRAYATAFLRALPHLSEKVIYLRMSLMIGSYIYLFSDTNRLDDTLPTGVSGSTELVKLDEVVAYVTAGMRS